MFMAMQHKKKETFTRIDVWYRKNIWIDLIFKVLCSGYTPEDTSTHTHTTTRVIWLLILKRRRRRGREREREKVKKGHY